MWIVGLLASEVKLVLGKRKQQQQSNDGAISWQAGLDSPAPSIREHRAPLGT